MKRRERKTDEMMVPTEVGSYYGRVHSSVNLGKRTSGVNYYISVNGSSSSSSGKVSQVHDLIIAILRLFSE